MGKKIKYVASRLREPSTLAGLGVLAILAGAPPGTVEVTTQAISSVLAALAVIVPDKTAE